jgi:hypothetical protein
MAAAVMFLLLTAVASMFVLFPSLMLLTAVGAAVELKQLPTPSWQ